MIRVIYNRLRARVSTRAGVQNEQYNFLAAKEPPLCAKFEIQNFSSKTLTTLVPKTGAEQQGSLKVVHSGT